MKTLLGRSTRELETIIHRFFGSPSNAKRPERFEIRNELRRRRLIRDGREARRMRNDVLEWTMDEKDATEFCDSVRSMPTPNLPA